MTISKAEKVLKEKGIQVENARDVVNPKIVRKK